MRALWHLMDMFNIHTYGSILHYLQKNKPDCVMTHNLKGMGYLIPLAIRHAGIKHIHTLHDVQLVVPTGLLFWKKENEEHKLQNLFHAWCSRLLFGSPHVVISPSLFLKTFYERRGFFPHSQRTVLANPMRSVGSATHDILCQKNLQSAIHFFAAGTLNEAKGILFLCRAFHKLPEQHIRLWIAGLGPDEEEIKRLCKNDSRIAFLGRLSHEKVLSNLQNMHYSIVPSLCYENSPTIIGESFSCGIPVIAADIGGAAEHIEDGVNGFVFTPADTSSLFHAMDRAIISKHYDQMRHAAARSMNGRDCASYVKHVIQIQTP